MILHKIDVRNVEIAKTNRSIFEITFVKNTNRYFPLLNFLFLLQIIWKTKNLRHSLAQRIYVHSISTWHLHRQSHFSQLYTSSYPTLQLQPRDRLSAPAVFWTDMLAQWKPNTIKRDNNYMYEIVTAFHLSDLTILVYYILLTVGPLSDLALSFLLPSPHFSAMSCSFDEQSSN